MLTLQNISYIHPNKDLLFENFGLTVNRRDKVVLICNNGSGKSTLLKIIAENPQASSGKLNVHTNPCYIPQIFGQ
jgi:ATPase subunit of ABC transporter with duplicated ATPase domains